MCGLLSGKQLKTRETELGQLRSWPWHSLSKQSCLEGLGPITAGKLELGQRGDLS
jgi:hypothetical protein